MPNVVYLDGPLEGTDHLASQAEIEEGQVIWTGPGGNQVIYTISRVGLYGRVVVVASSRNRIPRPSELFEHLLSGQAKAAAE